jgi:hypothetical protein
VAGEDRPASQVMRGLMRGDKQARAMHGLE